MSSWRFLKARHRGASGAISRAKAANPDWEAKKKAAKEEKK